MRLLDLFCGRWGWSRAFAARGWECVGVDWKLPPETPKGCEFLLLNVLFIDFAYVKHMKFDFIVASPPCEQFSVHGMKNFHPNPKYPYMGVRLFNHARALSEDSGVPYIVENVRAAQQFVGNAIQHCGPFYLWGNAVPPILPQGIRKGKRLGIGGYRTQHSAGSVENGAAIVATIPPELANCVADYAERLLEMSGTVANGR